MSAEPSSHPTDMTAPGNDDPFDPRAAAALLDRATRRAVRQLEPYPAWMMSLRAVAALAGCGALWLSVRSQHPYTGPSAAVTIPVIAVFVVVNYGATVALARRATAGRRGPFRLRPVELAVMAVVWVGIYAVMGVLAGAGASRSVVYGWYPTAVPLLVAGLAWASVMAVRRHRRGWLTGLATAVVGAGAALAGPRNAWLVAGVGLSLVLLTGSAVTARRQHRGHFRV